MTTLPHWLMVRLAEMAYEGYSDFRDKLPSLGTGVELIDYIDKPPAQAFAVAWRSGVAIVPRGTDFSRGHVVDFFSNVGVLARDWMGPGKAHRGYARETELMWPSIERLANQVQADQRLYLVGHSKGGAIATNLAAFFPQIGWNTAGLVTYGAPASLNREAGKAIVCPIHRFVNKYDFAPHMPPSPLIVHPSEKITISSETSIIPFKRHYPQNYVTAIDKRFPQ